MFDTVGGIPLHALVLHVVVIAGGISHERDVSLRSGRRVADSLIEHGLEVELRDPDASLLYLAAGLMFRYAWVGAGRLSARDDRAVAEMHRAETHGT